MLLASVKGLKPGTRLAQPIFHPKRDEIVLLEKGFQLDAEMIARLIELGIPYVWVEFPKLEELDARFSAAICSQHFSLYAALRDAINRFQDRVAVEMNFQLYCKAIDSILQEIIHDPDHEVLTTQLAVCAPELAGHLANCCYLSLLLGAHLSGYLRAQRKPLPPSIADDTSRLGLGALLHDIGKLDAPDDVRRVSIINPENEWPEYRAHTRVGYELVKGRIPGPAANVVLHHHQRFDGSGFPPRRDHLTGECREPYQGEQIHIFNRIVGLVDAFDHLLTNRRQIVPTIIALRALTGPEFRGWFDPVVVDTLGRLIPPFMIGTVVRLCEGSNAVIVANHADAPCQPTVRLLTGNIHERGARVRGKPIDLRVQRKLWIASVDGVDVSQYLFEGPLSEGCPDSLPRRPTEQEALSTG